MNHLKEFSDNVSTSLMVYRHRGFDEPAVAPDFWWAIRVSAFIDKIGELAIFEGAEPASQSASIGQEITRQKRVDGQPPSMVQLYDLSHRANFPIHQSSIKDQLDIRQAHAVFKKYAQDATNNTARFFKAKPSVSISSGSGLYRRATAMDKANVVFASTVLDASVFYEFGPGSFQLRIH